MTFLWSDAWILQAIALASRERPATLGEILGAADAVNHAMPVDDELHGALSRLTGAGYVEETGQGFRLTDRVPSRIVDAIAASGLRTGRDEASKFLGAEQWSHERNVGDPRNSVRYPGLTPERIRAADEEYRRRISRLNRRAGDCR